jgi:hypothetical protein
VWFLRGGRLSFSGVEAMTFRIPERGDQVRFINPLTPRPYIALVRQMVTVADGQIAADLLVVCNDGSTYAFAGVRYRDATPDPRVPGMCWQFLDDDDDEDAH